MSDFIRAIVSYLHQCIDLIVIGDSLPKRIDRYDRQIRTIEFDARKFFDTQSECAATAAITKYLYV